MTSPLPPGPPDPPVQGPPTGPWDAADGGQAGTQSGPRARTVVIIGGALTTLVAIVVTAWVLIGEDEPQAAVTTPESPAASDGSPGSPAPPDQAIEAVLPELQAFVAEERGHEFTEPVDVDVLDADAYRDRIIEDFRQDIDEDREDIERAGAQYEALGLLDPDVDIVASLESYLSTGTAGFYDPETRELVVLGSELTPNLRVTLVHELTHALDDQVFGLDRPELDDRDDEAAFTFSALTEGNAGRVENAYVEALTPQEQLDYVREAGDAAAGVDFDAIPPVLLIEQEFVYGDGFEFVNALLDDGGNDSVDRAFRELPVTTEGVLEPEAYLDGEGFDAVATPASVGEVVEEGIAGQFLLELLVNGRLGGEGVPEWIGDRYVAWEDDGETCVRIAYAGDLDDLEDALGPWSERTGGAVDRSDDEVTITGCTG